MDQTWRLFLINLAKDEEPCGLSVLGDSTPYQIYSVFYLQKRSINAEFYLMKDPVKVQNKIILSKHLIINHSQTIINQQYTLTIRFIIKMNIIDNTKSPMLDTAGRTQSYHYDNPNDSPPESVSFRQSASPSQLNPFTNIKDKPYNSYIGRSHMQSHHEPYTTLTSSLPQGLKSHLTDDLDQLILQQRIQVESLYLQIGRLTQELHLSQQLKAIQCKKIRQQCQQIMYKQASQLRQNHQNQVQVFELQIRKMKEQINDKNDETKRLHELLQRQKQSKEIQKNRFNEEVRMLIEKKYSEVFQQKQVGQTKLREFEQNKKSEVEELQYTFNKEIRNLNKMLEQRQEEVQRIRLTTERQQRQKMKQIQYLQSQLEIIQKRNELRLSQEYQKYDKVRTKFNQLIMQFSEIGQKSRTELHQLFQQQYNQLVSMLKAKSAENEQIKQQIKAQIQVYSKEIEAVREQNYALQNKINQKAHNAAEDMELLKVKLASLHQNDVKQIKQLYELKLKNLSGNLYRMDEQNSKLREMTNLLSAEKYQQKKAFQITISQLNSKILKFRMGMTSMESDYRQKMQNQKSLMLMTSKTFLKDAQAKNVSHKFLEEQIRKLRQLMDLQSRQNQNSQKVVQQRILAANYELQQLSNRVLSIAKEKKQLQQELSELRRQKDEEISRLRSQLNIFQVQQTGQIPELKIIQEQRHQILKHKEEIGILKDKLLSLESRMKQMKQVSERLQMENSIHLDQAKKQYHIIAEQHLKDFKSYYQEKMRVAQEQKTQLKKIISSQTEKITELIKKYKETEQGLREATRLMKKRTQLQQKVMNIGLDVNLVKNLAQLLPNPKNQ